MEKQIYGTSEGGTPATQRWFRRRSALIGTSSMGALGSGFGVFGSGREKLLGNVLGQFHDAGFQVVQRADDA